MIEVHLDTNNTILSEKKVCIGVLVFLTASFCLLICDYAVNLQRAYEYNKEYTIAYLYTPFFIQYAITFVLHFQFVLVALAIWKSIQAMNDSFEDISHYLYIRAFHENKITSYSQINQHDGHGDPIYRSMESINYLADSLSMNKIRKNMLIGKMHVSVQPQEAVSRLAALHCLLCDLVQKTNSTYGPILIAFLLSFLIHLIMSPYYLILQLQDSHQRFYKLGLQFLWCIFHTVNMFIVVEPCHRTAQEFDRTQELVSRLMQRLDTNCCQLAAQLELFSRQLLLRSVSYSPMGMCKMNRPLITSIIGGVTTYLVILIQFQKLSDINGTGSVK